MPSFEEQRNSLRGVTVPAGQEMYLNHETPHGLFEDGDGNRYIVAADDEYGPLAIVLRHRLVELFTAHVLMPYSIIRGRWWGPYRVRLTSSVGWESRKKYPGVVFVVEDSLGIDCHRGIHGGSGMPLGILHESSGEVCDAESWTIEAIETPFRFCARSRRGTLRYGPTPSKIGEPQKRERAVELDPRSVLNSDS